MSRSLTEAAGRVAADRELIQRTVNDADTAGDLFARLRQVVRTLGVDDLSITVYGSSGTPLAWTGRPSELPAERVAGPSSLFVAPGPLGSRLVALQPVLTATSAQGAPARLATVATERVLSPAVGVRRPTDEELMLQTRYGAVYLRARYEGAGARQAPGTFVVEGREGEPLLEVEARAGELARARGAWRRRRPCRGPRRAGHHRWPARRTAARGTRLRQELEPVPRDLPPARTGGAGLLDDSAASHARAMGTDLLAFAGDLCLGRPRRPGADAGRFPARGARDTGARRPDRRRGRAAAPSPAPVAAIDPRSPLRSAT